MPHLVNYADIPTVTVGPGALGEAHGSNESLAAAELLDAIKALVSLALGWTGPWGASPFGGEHATRFRRRAG